MEKTKPVFVLVPGAFHLHSSYDQVIAELHSAGYETQTGTLKSVNSASASLVDDVTFIREELLLSVIEKGKDVVVVFHSYAGIPGSMAIKDLSKSERASKGQESGIIGLIYMCAFIPKEGASLYDMIGGQWAPWQEVNEETGLISVRNPKQTFYEDVPDPVCSQATAAVQGHSIKSFTSSAGTPGYPNPAYNGHRAYIRTGKDEALPVFVQDMMLEASGVEWVIKEVDTSHSPFLSKPKDLCNSFVSLAEEFIGKT